MKKYIRSFIILFIICFRVSAQPSGHDAEIMRLKGKWNKHETVNLHNDDLLFSGQFPVLLKKTDSLANLLKESYPEPTGLEAYYYASISNPPLFKGAPASYTLSSLYESYYFNTNLNKILLGGETETWVSFFINHFGDFMHNEGDWMINNSLTTVYTSWPTDGEWKGFPVYKNQYAGKKEEKAIILTRNGKLPFIPLTQKEYLLALKYKWDQEKKNFYDANSADKDFQKTLESVRNNKGMSQQMKDDMIVRLQKDHESMMQGQSEAMSKLTAQYDQKIKMINDYLASHSEKELQAPTITSQLWNFPGYFGADKNKKVTTPVRIDLTYFKTNLPRYIPQFIVMQWTIGNDVAKTEFGKKLEADFPIGKLERMVNAVKKDDDWSDKAVVKGPDMAAIRKKAELYADSVFKTKRSVFVPLNSASLVAKDTSTGYKIPPRNGAMLDAMPSKKMSSPELKPYIENIEKKYTSLLLSQGNKLPDVSTISSAGICNASAEYLLNGASDEAAWCAFKAIEKSPADIAILSNAGAVLNACGFQPVAIPVLETALDKSPNNSTIQNNIGEGYLALGDINKAGTYLQQALAGCPNHPHANYAMACIQYAKGNNAGALSYVQKSLHTSFTDGAMHLYYKLKPNGRLWDVLKSNYKPTDYFNEDKYHLPPQCETVADEERLKAEYKGYREMVEKVKKQFDDIRKSENELGEKSMMDKTKNYKNSGIRTSPFTELGTIMVKEISFRLADEQDRLSRAQTIYKKEIHDLTDEYEEAYKHAESCAEQLALANAYMPAMAGVTVEYQKTWLPVYRDYFDDMAYWGRIQLPDKHLQRAAYAAAASGFLGELLRLAETHFLRLCDPSADLKKEAEDYKIPEPDCGINIGMNFIIGSFKVDCEKIEYHFGGLLVADVVHTYRTHCTTIAIGAGLDLKFGGEKLKAGPIEGGFAATGKMQYFLTFDGTRPSDQGFIWEGALQYEQTFNTEIESGIKKIDEVKTNSLDLSAKTILSVHDGFTSSGSVYEHLDKVFDVKPEKQENKNIKIFNSNR